MTDEIPPRKYFTETAVGLCTSTVMVLSPDQLHRKATMRPEEAANFAECHIYLICRRPVLSIDPKTFEYSPTGSTGHFVQRIDGKERRIGFRKKVLPPEGQTIEVAPYPHRALVTTENGKLADIHWPAWVLSIASALEDDTLRDMEVIYVGQAYGDGSRTALDRLRSHSTLQRILAESAATRPDDEVILLLFKYEPATLFTHMDGITNDGITGAGDHEHFMSLVDNPLSERQEISLAEAGLIRYFAPHYNEVYKTSFPSEGQKLLDECYRLDFAGLIVEIDTEDVGLRLWSPATPGKGRHHIAKFDLHDPTTRRSFFSLVDTKGRYALMNKSGPTF